MEKYAACQFNLGRVRTVFWIRKTFSRLFSKTIISFSRLKVIKWVINRDLKKNEETKPFPWCAANVQARLNKIWPARKKKFTCKALTLTSKNLKTFYPFFKTLSLLYRLFPGLKNCWGNLKTFFKISRLCTSPGRDFKRISSVLLTRSFANNTSPILVTVIPLCCKALNSISQSYQATGTRLSSSDSLIPLRAVIIWRKICTMRQRKIMTNHCIKDTVL